MIRQLSLSCIAAILAASPARADDKSADSPWGIASSASSYKEHAEWFPKMREAGISTVRLFPEWRTVQPAKDTWKWDLADVLVKAAADNKLRINGVLMGSTPWTKSKIHAFPMDHLDDWSTYVGAAVGRYKGQIRHWEVWNEGNGGFNDEKHTTADYAKLSVAAYTAAKTANPDAQIGLSVASYDPAYLNQAALAMAKEGKPGSFDFLAIHPYEIADGLADVDGEIPYLWMSKLLRDQLKITAPGKANVPIWITEVSRRLEKRKDRTTSDIDAAKSLVKLYTMALAQGVECTQWFEARDPSGEDAGFGLLARDGKPRAAYTAMQTLTKHLGPKPQYAGWISLLDRGYGFAFETTSGPVLVLWMPAGDTLPLALEDIAKVVDPITGVTSVVPRRTPLKLTDSPLIIAEGVPALVLKEVRNNRDKRFPWGGDHFSKDSISLTLGQHDVGAGVSQTNRKATPHCTYPDGSTGIILRGDQTVSFYTHPSFAGLDVKDFHIRITVRRLAPGNVGMNLHYEVADSQGKMPYKNKGTWFSVPADDGWHTMTWHVTDACFAKMWGHDFSIRPEQSVPFVIGKVEVSKTAFR